MLSNLYVVELCFVGAPDAVVEAVVVSDEPEALVSVVLDVSRPGGVEVDSFNQSLVRSTFRQPNYCGYALGWCNSTLPQYSMAACSYVTF